MLSINNDLFRHQSLFLLVLRKMKACEEHAIILKSNVYRTLWLLERKVAFLERVGLCFTRFAVSLSLICYFIRKFLFREFGSLFATRLRKMRIKVCSIIDILSSVIQSYFCHTYIAVSRSILDISIEWFFVMKWRSRSEEKENHRKNGVRLG